MTLVVLVGPSAVGKMSVGQELAKLTSFKLFHNHQTIDLVLPYFPWGTRSHHRLVNEFRFRMFKEFASSDLPGVIFTLVMDFTPLSGDHRYLAKIIRIFRRRGARVCLVELQAPQSVRLLRNRTPNRLKHKTTKRDLKRSNRLLCHDDAKYQLASPADYRPPAEFLKLDTARLSARRTAWAIRRHFLLN